MLWRAGWEPWRRAVNLLGGWTLWQWMALQWCSTLTVPKGFALKGLPDYLPLDDQPSKVWYIRASEATVQLQHAYLQCLCSPTEFWNRLEHFSVKHLRKNNYYANLLKGDIEAAALPCKTSPIRGSTTSLLSKTSARTTRRI